MTTPVTSPPPVYILGVPVHPVTYVSFLDLIAAFIVDGGAHQICTANPEFVMTARRQPQFLAVLRTADLVLPDGVGLLWAARRLGTSLPERVTGSDGIYRLAERAARSGWRLYLLGAAPGVAERTADILTGLYPGLKIVGTFAGSPGDEDYPDHPPTHPGGAARCSARRLWRPSARPVDCPTLPRVGRPRQHRRRRRLRPRRWRASPRPGLAHPPAPGMAVAAGHPAVALATATRPAAVRVGGATRQGLIQRLCSWRG